MAGGVRLSGHQATRETNGDRTQEHSYIIATSAPELRPEMQVGVHPSSNCVQLLLMFVRKTYPNLHLTYR